MRGAIIGDIIGSRFEFNNLREKEFDFFTEECDFTDDTICTVAIMEAILENDLDYARHLQKWCRKYSFPKGGYGASFAQWVNNPNPQPYNSFGNGAAMRVSPVAWAFNTVGETISQAIATANVSHNHPEGIKGAIATVHAIMRLEASKDKTQAIITEQMYYDPFQSYERGRFDETCQGTVPVALRIIDDSSSFEDAMQLTMQWGGDSDTLGAIVGGMAEALYGVPEYLWSQAEAFLPFEMKMIIEEFYKRFVI
ncbi:ADP-ribosylglycohydrolase [Prevotella sp. tc2-28]|uniref:ADP-ribosylglycohydrolase family protein n=1 Tax=Prevotella sp. tc2-28 TaxID=1761888 RepID=UPI00089772D6|nr:ADP-ribosylglycohydrolase family protein [Prevotella sp. tc2-28]SEA80235.1 ADP-ribosylglycohydrolase [Prevotella sp. tc2-28]